MASSTSALLGLELPANGDQAGTWGATLNTNLGTLIEQAIAGSVTVPITGTTTTLTATAWSSNQARNAVINITGTLTATTSVICPATSKLYVVYNGVAASIFLLTFKTSAGTGVTIPRGAFAVLYCDGTNVYNISATMVGNALALPSTTGQFLSTISNANTAARAYTLPDVAGPIVVGTAPALTGTNFTGTAASLTAGNVTTNANLTGNVTSVGNVTTIAALPAISGAALTSLTGANVTGAVALATNVTTNANLTGNVTSVGNATTIASLPAISGAALTNLTGANVTGTVGAATALGAVQAGSTQTVPSVSGSISAGGANKIIEWFVPRSGTYRVYMTTSYIGTGLNAQVYVNGIAAGAYRIAVATTTDDVTVTAGGYIQIYAGNSGGTTTVVSYLAELYPVAIPVKTLGT
jgi:hypothetical protein